MTGPRLDPTTQADILTRYQNGHTAANIARTLGCSQTTVNRYLRAARVTRRDDRNGTGPTNLTNQIHALGTTTRHIRQWAQTRGIHVPAAGQVPQTVIDAYTQAHNPNQEGTP